jgi:predicted nucleic acid-binding protein
VTVLADTSIWVRHLRRRAPGVRSDLDPLLSERRVVMLGVVAAELLTALLPDRRAGLWPLLDGIGWVELDRTGWRRVGDVSAELRQNGLTTPLSDIAVAVASVTGDAELWAEDAHFDRIAAVMTDLRRYTPR